MLRRFYGVAAIAALFFAFLIAAAPAEAAYRTVMTGFKHGGQTVRVEMFKPVGVADAPAALVLHGASGIGRGWFVYPFAKALASRGVAAAVVHYYDGLGRRKNKATPRIFETRDKILRAAIGHVLRQKGVRKTGLGIYGMSLGGFHALSLGVRDERVKAVVSLGGALSGHIPERQVARLPPTLILHGSRDRVVPFRRAIKVAQAMERYGAPGDMKVYKGEGHSFSQRAHADAVDRVARFMSGALNASRTVAQR